MYSDFLELIDRYRNRHNLNEEPLCEEALLREEEMYGRLPPTYREFLKTCPTGSFFDDCFVLYQGPLSFEDLSPKERTPFEEGLLPFGDDNGGTFLCFDTLNSDANGEWPIVEYSYPHYRTQIANSFGEWVMGMVGLFV
jgi:hypothetical protein